MSWRVDQRATEKRNVSWDVREHREAGKRHESEEGSSVGGGMGSIAKSGKKS